MTTRVAGRPFAVLVLGGSGVFGARLCRLLAGDPGLAATIAGRDGARAAALAGELGMASLALDWRVDLDRVLSENRFDALVHAAGPFQGQPYDVAEICICHGVHYLDLADDAAFVCGIDRLDAAAKAAGVLVCAGASTAPAITSAVVDAAVAGGMKPLRIDFAIVPGNDAPRGLALVEAILDQAGKPIGAQPGRYGWGGPRAVGVPGLGRRWAAAVDLPEPTLFAARHGVRDVRAGAGLELKSLHFGLWLLAWAVRLRLLRSLKPFAKPLAWLSERVRGLGTDRGGLRVDIEDGGERRTWWLLAEGGDGPFIPATPAAALIRKLAAGFEGRGAMPCVGLLSLAEIEAEWIGARLRVGSGWGAEGRTISPSLYARGLGRIYDAAPTAIRALHDAGESTWSGRCDVDGADNALGRLVAWLIQLPPPAIDAPIAVAFEVRGGTETWTRRVGGRAMRSRQFVGARKPRGWLVEAFGPIAFDLAFAVQDGGLSLTLVGARFAGVPLPRFLWPRVAARETVDAGRFHFDVAIGLPLLGRLVCYRGWLTPDGEGGSRAALAASSQGVSPIGGKTSTGRES